MNIRNENINVCLEYANKNHKYFKQGNRTIEEHKRHIAFGKLSEIYAAILLVHMGENVIGPSLKTSTKPDGGFDLIHNSIKTNVKFLWKENVESNIHNKVYIKHKYDKSGGCNEYLLMLISEDLSSIEYRGSINFDFIDTLNHIPRDEFAQYLPINLFIDSLRGLTPSVQYL